MVWGYTLMCLIYGTTFLAIRAGDNAGMPPFLFAALRFSAAGIITLAFLLVRQRGLFPRGFRAYWDLAQIGFFNTTAVFAIVYFVEQYVPSGYAALMSATMPLLVMLVDRIANKQTITVLQCIGLILGFAGVLAIAWPGLRGGVPHWVGCTIALVIANVMAAIGALQSKRTLARGTSPFIVNGFQVLFGGVGLFILAAFVGQFSLTHIHWSAGLTALVYLTVFGSIIASTLFFWLVKREGALLASTWTYVSPVIAVAVGYLWYREPVYVLTAIGAVTILTGVLLINARAFREAFRLRASAKRQAPPNGVESAAGS